MAEVERLKKELDEARRRAADTVLRSEQIDLLRAVADFA